MLLNLVFGMPVSSMAETCEVASSTQSVYTPTAVSVSARGDTRGPKTRERAHLAPSYLLSRARKRSVPGIRGGEAMATGGGVGGAAGAAACTWAAASFS
jgi:hypothetical protein